MISNGEIPPELSVEAWDRWGGFCNALERVHLALPGDAISPDTIKKVFALSDFVARSCVQALEFFWTWSLPWTRKDPIFTENMIRTWRKKIKGVTMHQALVSGRVANL